ncbi:hypothetical protein HK102_004889 [Quaeritorhiza haematococci]|nr:hypothetical protein HK102_004889 [Quaeritorhiza haematococci]
MPGAIAPITGRFRKRIVKDLFFSISIGTAFAVYFWNGVHVPYVQERVTYINKVKKEIEAEHAAFHASNQQ